MKLVILTNRVIHYNIIYNYLSQENTEISYTTSLQRDVI